MISSIIIMIMIMNIIIMCVSMINNMIMIDSNNYMHSIATVAALHHVPAGALERHSHDTICSLDVFQVLVGLLHVLVFACLDSLGG